MPRCHPYPCRSGSQQGGPQLGRQNRVDIHVDAVVVNNAVVHSKNIATRQVQRVAVESTVIHVHEPDDGALVDHPQLQNGVAQIGDRVAKRPGRLDELGLGVSRVGVAEAECTLLDVRAALVWRSASSTARIKVRIRSLWGSGVSVMSAFRIRGVGWFADM
jgi:hypothetical protein